MKAGLLAIVFAVSVAALPQTNPIQIVLVGQVRKIDIKNNVITIRERISPPTGARRAPPQPPDLGPGFPPSGPPRGGRGGQVDTRVNYSADTIFKLSNQKISVQDLKVGDSVRVLGKPKEKEVSATEIERLKR